MSSGDDRSGPEGPNDKTSNSNNLNTVTKYNVYTGFVLPQYCDDPDVIAALGRMPSAARTTATEPNNNTNNTPGTMGIQSQLRNGSIKACKKKATTKHKFVRRKEIQLAIGGGEAFVEVKHCRVCKLENDNFVAGYEKVRVPKRTHHPRCHRNGEFKAKSRRSVQVERIAARNITLNNAPIDDLRRPGTSAAEKHTALFPHPRMGPTTVTTGAADRGKKKNRNLFKSYLSLTLLRYVHRRYWSYGRRTDRDSDWSYRRRTDRRPTDRDSDWSYRRRTDRRRTDRDSGYDRRGGYR
jgi:hypothetical protein